MKKLLTVAAVVVAALSSHAMAQDDLVDVSVDEAISDLSDARDARTQGYNIWFCAAVRRGPIGYNAPFYFGASYPFSQGSGQGQQARYNAQQQAFNACGGQLYCVSDCYVQRFTL